MLDFSVFFEHDNPLVISLKLFEFIAPRSLDVANLELGVGIDLVAGAQRREFVTLISSDNVAAKDAVTMAHGLAAVRIFFRIVTIFEITLPLAVFTLAAAADGFADEGRDVVPAHVVEVASVVPLHLLL